MHCQNVNALNITDNKYWNETDFSQTFLMDIGMI